MRSVRDYPIKQKLVGIIMLTSVVAVLLACVLFIAYEQVTYRRTMVRDFALFADIFDENLAPGLAFMDIKSMDQTLATMREHPHILAAAVLDKVGARVASYARNQQPGGFPWPAREEPGSHFQHDRLDTFQRITLAGEVIGTIYIASDLTEQAARKVRFLLIGGLVLLLSGVAAYLLAARLQRVISVPIFDLALTASRVAAEQNYGLRAVKHGQDELGSLIDRFNEMLAQIQRQELSLLEANEQLEQRVAARTHELQAEVAGHQRAREELTEAQQRLIQTSRQAGMAEVATSVLHNVGNVLNSVSVSAEVVAGKVRQLRAGGLKTVASLLREHAHDLPAFLAHDPRGKELPDYLLKLIEHLAEPQPGMLQELELLRKNIEHIKEIVATQQRHARGSGVMETLAVAELVEDALSINAAGFGRHEVQLIQEFSPVPPVVTDRHKVLQILVNLVNNAKYALDKASGDRRLVVRVAGNGTEGVRIEVIDNGVGIAPENLTRVFQHGFTTKKDGHGFGLHSGALAAKELGGRLTAHSDGLGHGAVFTLDLPWQHQKA
jgi:signal transduction histidine kinase